jgi:capsular polysaccharide biosynthesis protein
MTAAVGATGVRCWLQARHATWLTPKRLRNMTFALFVAALVASTVAFSGSSQPTRSSSAVSHLHHARD